MVGEQNGRVEDTFSINTSAAAVVVEIAAVVETATAVVVAAAVVFDVIKILLLEIFFLRCIDYNSIYPANAFSFLTVRVFYDE